ncbi:MAG: hypothetical protein JJE36_06890 [Coriobacteriia bacterium]|nr:hypothetical protein [Coriobacteriia bacterium]
MLSANNQRFVDIRKSITPQIINVFLALMSTYALIVKLKNISTAEIASTGVIHSPLVHLLTDLRISLSVSPLYTTILLVVCYMFIRRVREKYHFSRQELLTFWLLGLLFALFSVYGSSYAAHNSAIQLLKTTRGLIKNVLAIAGYTVFFSYALRFLYSLLNNITLRKTGNASEKMSFKSLAIVTGSLLICWAPFIITHYPGMLTADSTNQLLQFVGIKDITYQQLTIPLSQTVFLNDSNPVFTTFLLGWFYRFGNLIGSQNVGMFIYIILQSIILAGSLGYSLLLARQKALPNYLIYSAFVCFAFLPFFPLYASVILPKSALVPGIYLLFIIMLYQLIYERDSKMTNVRTLIAFGALELLLMLFVKSGFYVVLFTALALCIYGRKYWKYMLCATLIPLFIFKVLFTGMLLPALDISPGKSAELYSIPFQQTARYVIEHGDEVTPAEKTAINRVLKYDQLASYYKPTTSDGIKDYSYRPERSGAELKAYFMVWGRQFLKHPLTYVSATYNNQYRFFQINNQGKIFYSMSTSKDEQRFLREGKVRADLYKVEGSKRSTISTPRALETPSAIVEGSESLIINLPGFNFLSSLGSYGVIYLTLIAFAALKRMKKYLLLMIPTMTNYLILIASPYSAQRYLLPVIYTLFIFIVVYIEEVHRSKQTEMECS